MGATWLIVHGRFQPFHRGHLEYLTIALQRSRYVVVGITNPDLGRIAAEATSDHRHLSKSNPFTYFERHEMVTRSMCEAGADARNAQVRIVPFDVSNPLVWSNYLPTRSEHLVTVNEAWDDEKARRFRSEGYVVHVVDGNLSRITATDVRRRIASGDETWRALVPEGTVSTIDEYGLSERLRAD